MLHDSIKTDLPVQKGPLPETQLGGQVGVSSKLGGTAPLVLLALVLLHLFLHALFVPAYEGPDEPFHLARVAAFLNQPLGDALLGREIPGAIVSAVEAHPCATGKYRMAGCQPPRSKPEYFNVLRPHAVAGGGRA